MKYVMRSCNFGKGVVCDCFNFIDGFFWVCRRYFFFLLMVFIGMIEKWWCDVRVWLMKKDKRDGIKNEEEWSVGVEN